MKAVQHVSISGQCYCNNIAPLFGFKFLCLIQVSRSLLTSLIRNILAISDMHTECAMYFCALNYLLQISLSERNYSPSLICLKRSWLQSSREIEWNSAIGKKKMYNSSKIAFVMFLKNYLTKRTCNNLKRIYK